MPLGAWEFYTVLDDDPASEETSTGSAARRARTTPPPAVPAVRAPEMAIAGSSPRDVRRRRAPPRPPRPRIDDQGRGDPARRLRRFASTAATSRRDTGRGVTAPPWSSCSRSRPAGACTVNRSSTPCGQTSASTTPRRACTRQRTTPAGHWATAMLSSSALRPCACVLTTTCRSTQRGSSSSPSRRSKTAASQPPRRRSRSTAGELLPHDLYEPWAERHRMHLGRLYPELLHQAEDWHQALSADPYRRARPPRTGARYAEVATGQRHYGSSTSSTEVMRRRARAGAERAGADLRRQVLATTGHPSVGDCGCNGRPGGPAAAGVRRSAPAVLR